jgi:uncharacterized membrane protein
MATIERTPAARQGVGRREPPEMARGAKRARSKIVVAGNRGVKVVKSCTVRKPASVLYSFWRDFENIARITKHPIAVTRISDVESHWSVPGPGDNRVEWDAVIINDAPNRLIAWRSRDGAEVANAGSVRFEDGPPGEGTEVTVALEYNAPGGKLGALLAKLSGEEPAQQVAEALRRFKALMEAGEIPTTEGQPVGEPQRSKKKKGKR